MKLSHYLAPLRTSFSVSVSRVEGKSNGTNFKLTHSQNS